MGAALRFYFLLLSICWANLSHAEIVFSALSTDDSKIIVSGSGLERDSDIWITMQHKNAKERLPISYFVKPKEDGTLSKTIYLYEGAGDYLVSVWVRTSDQKKISSNFYLNTDSIISNSDPRNLKWMIPTDLVESDSPLVVSIAQVIANHADLSLERFLPNARSELQNLKLAKAIHDWVSDRISYSVKDFLAVPVPFESALHVLTANQYSAVCSGYALVVTALARAMGLRARVAKGYSVISLNGLAVVPENLPQDTIANHAWNEIEISPNKWVVMDATWDSGYLTAPTEMTGEDGKKIYDWSKSIFIKRWSSQYFNMDPKLFDANHRLFSYSEYE